MPALEGATFGVGVGVKEPVGAADSARRRRRRRRRGGRRRRRRRRTLEEETKGGVRGWHAVKHLMRNKTDFQ
jgi:hypothetical protein